MFDDLLNFSEQASNGPRLKCLVYPKQGEPFEAYLEEPKKMRDHLRLPKYCWRLPQGELFYRTAKAERIFQAGEPGTAFQARFCETGSDEESSVRVELI